MVPDSWISFWIHSFVADAAAVDLNGIKTVLGKGLSTFFFNGKPTFNNVPKILPKNLLSSIFKRSDYLYNIFNLIAY